MMNLNDDQMETPLKADPNKKNVILFSQQYNILSKGAKQHYSVSKTSFDFKQIR